VLHRFQSNTDGLEVRSVFGLFVPTLLDATTDEVCAFQTRQIGTTWTSVEVRRRHHTNNDLWIVKKCANITRRVLFSRGRMCKFSYVAHKAAPISDSSALRQTPAEAVRLWTMFRSWNGLDPSWTGLDWTGFGWIRWDECDPVLVSNDCTVDTVSFKLWFMNFQLSRFCHDWKSALE